jgi:hypothetical protein
LIPVLSPNVGDSAKQPVTTGCTTVRLAVLLEVPFDVMFDVLFVPEALEVEFVLVEVLFEVV